MVQALLDLIEKEFSDECGDTILFNKDGLHIGDVIDNLFSTAEDTERVKSYNIAVPCIYEDWKMSVYMLIVSWINADGSLDTYYERIESV